MANDEPPGGYLVECFWPGVEPNQVRTIAERAGAAAAAAQRQGRNVIFLGSILVFADETVFCFFEGRYEDVRAIAFEVRLPFDRILRSLSIGGADGR